MVMICLLLRMKQHAQPIACILFIYQIDTKHRDSGHDYSLSMP